ncbi:MAG: Slp family lipoprotein [Deltaproteobacteria bacterium]|nr:Slp family lipoprotein [Deltaproteobacteria bacterium]
MKNLILVLAALVVFAGCSVMPKTILKEVDRDITLDMVRSRPEQFVGKRVLWGGKILGTDNLEEHTEIEVLESSLGYDDTPANGTSKGRFIIQSKQFLDSNIYKANKRITVAGTIKGVEVRKIGKSDYRYPIITPIDMRLSEQPPQTPYPDYYNYPPYMYGPYGPYGPYNPFYPSSPYGPTPYPYRYPYPWPYPYPPFP